MSDQSSEKEFVCFTCLSLFSNAELVRVNGAEYCHTCAVEVLLDENERLSEGWLADRCLILSCTSKHPRGPRGGKIDQLCVKKCKHTRQDGDYCERAWHAVRGVVDGREG